MGYFSSESTSSTQTAPLSAEGRQWDAAFSDILIANMDGMGYELNPQEVTEFEDPQKAKQLQTRVETYQAQVDKLTQDILKNPQPNQTGNVSQPNDPRQGQLKQAQNQLQRAQDDLGKVKQVTYTDFNIKKKPDPRVQQAIDQFGAGSAEAAKIEQQIKDDNAFKAEAMAGIESEYLRGIQKLVKGDLSYTAEQKASVDQFIDPVRDVVLKTIDDLNATVQAGDKSLRESLNDVSTQIDRTGFDVMDALQAASIQIDKSGQNLMTILQEVNKSAENKARFQFDLLSQQADKKAAQQASLLGLPPGSMTEKLQAAKLKNNALTAVQLELASAEAQGALGIAHEVEQGKKNISLSRIMLAEQQGGKREGVAQTAFGITQNTVQQTLGIAGQKGSALASLEEKRQAELKDLVTGGILTRAQAAQSGMAFNTQQQGANLQNNLALLSPVQQRAAIEQQRTFAESTTRQSSTPSGFDIATGFIGTAASVAAPFMTGGASLGIGAAAGGIGHPTGVGEILQPLSQAY